MNLTFYSFNDFPDLHKDYTIRIPTVNKEFPAIFFLRNSGWNDYTYVTSFKIYYRKSKGGELKHVGLSKIIQKDKRETELPDKFGKLGKKFYSRFTLDFYEFLNSSYSKKEKKEILKRLRDINFDKKLEKELNSGKNKDLYEKYQKSILRDLSFWYSGDREYPKELDELEEKVEEYQEDSFIHNLLFVKAIFILEDFLSNEVKEHIKKYKIDSLQKLLKNQQAIDLRLDKFKLEELEIDKESFEISMGDLFLQKANEHINGRSFHNQKTANTIYRILFDINLDEIYIEIAGGDKERKFFEDAIEKRHGIVHSNGKDEVRDEIDIRPEDIEILIERIKEFITRVTKEIREKAPGSLP